MLVDAYFDQEDDCRCTPMVVAQHPPGRSKKVETSHVMRSVPDLNSSRQQQTGCLLGQNIQRTPSVKLDQAHKQIMAIATFTSSAGGSSAVPEKRVANFHDDSSDEELEGEMANGLSNSPVRSNGKAIGSALKKGDKGTKRRKAENDDTDSARTARKAEAEKLYEIRRELPFYQGEQSSDELLTTTTDNA